MKLVRSLAFLGFFLAALPCWAQDATVLYRVADVDVDISSSSAAKARDEAFLAAQKKAFGQLLARLGASEIGASEDEIALLVKAFEVQKERASGQRYKGTFAVQFKPDAVRLFLYEKNVAYTEARAQAIVVLPVLRDPSRAVLWDERTPWRAAWEKVAPKALFVPMILPSGDLDDIAKISVDEALDGKGDPLELLARKYGAGGALVAVLSVAGEAGDKPVPGSISVRAYDAEGRPRDEVEMEMAPGEETKTFAEELESVVVQIIDMIEGDWRQAHARTEAPRISEGQPAPSGGLQVFLPVDVLVPTLAEWARIREGLSRVPAISSIHVVTMARGHVRAELQFRGDIGTLQASLAGQGLRLEQTQAGNWSVRQDAAGR